MIDRLKNGVFLVFLLILACAKSSDHIPQNPNPPATGAKTNIWVTTADRSQSLTGSGSLTFLSGTGTVPQIVIDTTTRYQAIDGFGFSLTGGSAQLMNQKLSIANRSALLRELFLTEQNGIGISYLRISIGASDLDDHVFSYDDMPSGQSDITFSKFSLDPDRPNLIPILKEILVLNPEVKIMGSPWSAPTWMKTNALAKGGDLKPEYYDVYAQYLLKYIQEMGKEGIPIDAITIQNEPENPGNTPSMTMTSTQQNEFVKLHLGPLFQTAGVATKIILFDHNCDHPDYPIAILDDPQTKAFVAGTAFHMYLGDISALSTVHSAHPDKDLYFTEQWTSGKGDFGGDLRWHVKNLIVGAPRNWSRTVLEWNLAADENFNPHTNDGGCTECQGAITIHTANGSVSRNVSYYIVGHASKFVPQGSYRVASNIPDNLYNVAFITPEGKKVLIVVNDNNTKKTFSIGYKDTAATTSLEAGAVGTFVW